MKRTNLLLALAFTLTFLPFKSFAQTTTQTQASGTIFACGESYVDGMNRIWVINTGVQKPIQIELNYEIEDECDYIYVYAIDSNNQEHLIGTYTGSAGESVYISTVYPTGKAKVVFTSDSSISYQDGLWGVESYYTIDTNQSNFVNTYSTGNSIVEGKLGVGTLFPSSKLDVNGDFCAGKDGNKIKMMEWNTGAGCWIDLPVVSGVPTGIGTGGKGSNAWIAYAGSATQWFNNSSAGDICYRNLNGRLLFGNTPTASAMAISNNCVGVGTSTPRAKFELFGDNVSTKSVHCFTGTSNSALNCIQSDTDGHYLEFGTFGTKNTSKSYGLNLAGSNVLNMAPKTTGFGAVGTLTAAPLIIGTNNLERMRIDQQGNVGIGTVSPDALLTVNGIVHAKEIKVDLAGALADYVFDPEYKLMPLHQVENFIKTNSHLPAIPSAAEVKDKGMSIGEMQNKLLQKIEELTLYVIEQQKQIDSLKKELGK